MSLVQVKDLSKHFKILNRREGLGGVFRFAFTFIIPIGLVSFYLSQLFLRPQEVSSLVYFSPVIGIGLFMLTY